MTKSVAKLKSEKKQITARLLKAEIALKSAQRRENLRLACSLITNRKASKAEILKRYPNVKINTLNQWLRNGTWMKKDNEIAGTSCHLPAEAEQVISAWLVQSAELGHPVCIKHLKRLAYHMIKDIRGNYPPSNNMDGWFYGFLKRNNCVTYCDGNESEKLKVRPKAQGLSKQRTLSMTPETVQGYASKCVQPFLDNHPEITLDHIGGEDEWQFQATVAIEKGKVVTPPGLLYTATRCEHDDHITVLSGYAGGHNLGPTEPEPDMVIGAGRTQYFTLESARATQAQILAAEALKRTLPAIVPAVEPAKKKQRRGQYKDGCIMRPSDCAEAERRRQAEEAELAAKRQIASRKKAEGDAAARAAVSDIMAQVVHAPEETVQTLKGEQLSNVLRVMGLPFSGNIASKQARIVAGVPGFMKTIAAEGGLESFL